MCLRLYDHRGIPLPVVRRLTRQVLVALDYLHTKCRIIHTGERALLQSFGGTPLQLPASMRHARKFFKCH
jgi:hypothetical protein